MVIKDKVFRKCDHPDCQNQGEFRAPKNRNLDDYYWFCLKHVSEYNKSWDFYKGMSIDEIEAENKLDMTWHEKTWKFGVNLDKLHKAGRLEDPFQIYNQFLKNNNFYSKNSYNNSNLSPKEKEALSVFNLSFPFSKDELKKRYKSLVKKHHPDLNHGSKDAEEKFKLIASSYAILIKKC